MALCLSSLAYVGATASLERHNTAIIEKDYLRARG